MVDVVDIPLSIANQVPGISGVEDVQLSVPQQGDIEDVVETAVRTETEQAVADALPDEIMGAPQDGQLDEDALASDLATALPEELSQVDIDLEGGLFGPTAGDLEDTLDAVLGDDDDGPAVETVDTLALAGVVAGTNSIAGVTADEAEAELRARGVDPDRPAEEVGRDRFEITTLNPVAAIGQLAADVRRTSDDVLDGITDIQDDLTALVDDLGDGLDTVLEDALEAVVPEIDGVALLEDPVGYFTAGITQGLDQAVDDEAQDRLQTAVDDQPPVPEGVR